MNICVGCTWQLEMNDVIDRGNIETSSSNIRGYQDTVGRGSKTGEKRRSEVDDVLAQPIPTDLGSLVAASAAVANARDRREP